MRRMNFRTGKGQPVRRQLLPLLLLPLLLVAPGCGDDDEDDGPGPTHTPTAVVTATRTATPVPTPTQNQQALACQKLVACDQCFTNDRGACLTASECGARLSTAEVDCIMGEAVGCDAQQLGDCLDVGCGSSGSEGPCETGGAR